MSTLNISSQPQQSTKSSLAWKLFERGGIQVIQLIVGIIIARLLDPSEYGEVALLTIFVSIATVFVQSGIGTALIQKKNIEEIEISSLFWYSFTLAILLYVLLFVLSGAIAEFYEMPHLSTYMKVMALTLFPGAFNSVQTALLAKYMQFKKQFIGGTIAALLSGVLGIGMAYNGYGAWALISQQLSYQVIICITFLLMIHWIPRLLFSVKKTLPMLKFGVKLLISNLIDTIYHNIESLVIGKFFSAATLAFCNKGKMFPLIVVNNIDGSIQQVMLPVFSKKQDDRSILKESLRNTISLSTFIVFPVMMLMAAASKPMIGLLLGEKWLESSIYVVLFCICAMLFPLQTANIQALNALGHSEVVMRYMVWKRILGLTALVAVLLLFKSPIAVVYSCIIAEIIGIVLLIPSNKKHLYYHCNEMLKDIVPVLIYSCIMFSIVYPISLLNWNYLLTLFVQGVVGFLVYALCLIATNNKNYHYVRSVLMHRNNV